MRRRTLLGIGAVSMLATAAAMPGTQRPAPAADDCLPVQPTDLGTLDLGVTKRVRGVFFVPRDRAFRDCLQERLDTYIRMAQRFFRKEMAGEGYLDASGFGKTFHYDKGPDGRWNVVYMVGEQEAAYYQDPQAYPGGVAFDEIWRRLPAAFHNNNVTVYIYDLAVVEGDHLLYTGQGGMGVPWEGEGAGYVLQGAHFLGVGFDTVAPGIQGQCAMFEQTGSSGLRDYDGDGHLRILTRAQYGSTAIGAALHELGHAFYLGHDFNDYNGDGIETNLMGNGFRRLSGRYSPGGYIPATALGPAQAGETDIALMFNQLSHQSCSDLDGDLVCDGDDICPGFDDFEDNDCDGRPDACDTCPYDPDDDTDADGICGDIDSCPLDPDNDMDSDGVCGDADNCPQSMNPFQEDADGDALGDACDACSNVEGRQNITIHPAVTLEKINSDSTPGDDCLHFEGEFALDPGTDFSSLDPLAKGARLMIGSSSGKTFVDVTIPGGAGWKANNRKTRYLFVDKARPATNNGIVQVLIKNRSKKGPRQVQVKIKGENGSYPIAAGDEPPRVTVVLGGRASAIAGECGETTFTVADCKWNGRADALKCKQ